MQNDECDEDKNLECSENSICTCTNEYFYYNQSCGMMIN